MLASMPARTAESSMSIAASFLVGLFFNAHIFPFGIGRKISVAFRSAKVLVNESAGERYFRRAKGDNKKPHVA